MLTLCSLFQDHYVAPTCGVASNERTARDITTQNLPPSITRSKDGEEGYSNSQHMLRKQQQVYESSTKVGCVQPPPNRTVFQRESPPPYHRSQSVGAISQSSAIARKTALIKPRDMTMTSPTTTEMSTSPAATQLSDNNNVVISSNFYLPDSSLRVSGEQCNCPPRCMTTGARRHTVIRGGATTPSALTSMSQTSSCLAGDAARRRLGGCQEELLHNCAIDSGCEQYGVPCGLGPPPPYTDTQCVPSDTRRGGGRDGGGGGGGGGIQYNSSI